MCGRFVSFAAGDEVVERFPLAEFSALVVRNNIAPAKNVSAIRSTDAR
jgi:hypothetical protein